jgi:hypothetical protein
MSNSKLGEKKQAPKCTSLELQPFGNPGRQSQKRGNTKDGFKRRFYWLSASTTIGKYRSRQQSAHSRSLRDASGLEDSHFAQTFWCRTSIYGSSWSLWMVFTMLTISERKRLIAHCASFVRRTLPLSIFFIDTTTRNTRSLIESQYSSTSCVVPKAS